MIWRFFLYAALGFFSGSILYGYLLAKRLKGVDITALSDDHNPGGTNAFLHAGRLLGVTAIALDLLKGFFPVLAACRELPAGHPLFALVLWAPVLGHCFSPLRGGRGGKGIAVSFGVLLGLYPNWQSLLALVVAMLFFSLIVVLQPHRLRTIAAFFCTGAHALLRVAVPRVRFGVVLLSLTVLFKHRHAVPGERAQFRLLYGRPVALGRRDSDHDITGRAA